jgi:hypothetical protein
VDEVRRLWDQELPDEEWVIRFLKAVGSDPDALPPELIAAAMPLVPVCRHGRPVWHSELPLAELAAAPFPKHSTRYGITLLNALAPLERWPPLPATRSSSPDGL